MQQLRGLVVDIIPAKTHHDTILAFIDSIVNKPRSALLLFSILLSVFFSSNAMIGIMRSFDKNDPRFVKRKRLKKANGYPNYAHTYLSVYSMLSIADCTKIGIGLVGYRKSCTYICLEKGKMGINSIIGTYYYFLYMLPILHQPKPRPINVHK